MPFTRLTSISELQRIFSEVLINKTNKITKVSPNSVVSGISYAASKVGQKAIKDVALIESNIFPDQASGQSLDNIADNYGIAPRYGASGSSTYIRLVADPGTQYLKNTHSFQSATSGINFSLENDITIGNSGVEYAKVQSDTNGTDTNVDPLSINQVNPIPGGHSYVINEYRAIGGRDAEIDEDFRKRIKEGSNVLAKNTLSALEQAFIRINNNILRIFYQGINDKGKIVIAIATQNGAALTTSELDQLLEESGDYFAITELKPFGANSYGVELKNIEWQPIDVSFRIEINNSFNIDNVRINIQQRMTNELDFRNFEPGKDKVEWDNLLQIAKTEDGVKYVPDQFFFPSADIATDPFKLPRIRGFRMMDLQGNIITDLQGNLQPVFYPNNPAFNFEKTVL